jgi:hypothetical protein
MKGFKLIKIILRAIGLRHIQKRFTTAIKKGTIAHSFL